MSHTAARPRSQIVVASMVRAARAEYIGLVPHPSGQPLPFRLSTRCSCISLQCISSAARAFSRLHCCTAAPIRTTPRHRQAQVPHPRRRHPIPSTPLPSTLPTVHDLGRPSPRCFFCPSAAARRSVVSTPPLIDSLPQTLGDQRLVPPLVSLLYTAHVFALSCSCSCSPPPARLSYFPVCQHLLHASPSRAITAAVVQTPRGAL
jgi:hypothetical protein